MENIINKNIFNDEDLNKLAPDYTPQNVVLRMQMRRTLAKDTHSHVVVRNTTWARKSIKKSKDSFNLNKEIIKLQQDFSNMNMRNKLKLKGFESLKVKATVCNNEDNTYDEGMFTNECEDNFALPEFSDNKELEIRNDNEFKLNTKVTPSKHLKAYRETRRNKRAKRSNGDLLDLNKDINENNEDIFRVACIRKHVKPQIGEDERENVQKQILYKDVPPIDSGTPMGDLQNLLIMMALESQPPKYDADIVEDSLSPIRTPKQEFDFNINTNNTLANHATDCEGIDNILNIIPIRVHISEREKYLMEKFTRKWQSYVSNRKKYVDEQRQTTLNNFFDKIAKRKKDMSQSSELEYKAKEHLKDYNTYQHRYKVQKHIIALQKAKLEEQNRLIEELKYNKIIEASRSSVDAMREEIRRTYYDIDRQLKPKIKCLTKELKIPDIEEPTLVLQCLKVPQFLQRMEKRAREREEKHAMIRERRQQMEEERVRIKQQTELAKAEMDKEEKMRRIIELKEKRKRERIENIRKKQWTERLRALIVMADLHYEKTLTFKYGIAPLRKLIAIKRDNIEKARAHYKFQLKNNIFLHWMWYTEDMWFERNFKAEDFYRKNLMRKVFKGFRMIHHTVILKKQVADDYYDLYVTQMGFRMFCKGVNVIRKENDLKVQKAIVYHNSNLLFKAFTCWRTLPALNALKREQEARKARWREKVLQVVPDYMPPED